MGQGSSYFVFIILEIPVPHIHKTHNFSPLCLIFLGYRSPPSFGHSRSLTSSSLLSIIPFLSVLRSASLHSVPSIHYILPLVPFIWEKFSCFTEKSTIFTIFLIFVSFLFIFPQFSLFLLIFHH